MTSTRPSTTSSPTDASEVGELLAEQRAYYEARASEYDEWFLRRGRYDRGEAVNAKWRAEVAEIQAAGDAFAARAGTGDVLEIAAGTGLWTARWARTAATLTALDASPEMLAINRVRCQPLVDQRAIAFETRVVDIFGWQPERRWDAAVFTFWLSHIPPSHFDGFLTTVEAAVAPGGRVFFADSRRTPDSQAIDHTLAGSQAGREDASLEEVVAVRRLNDGSAHRVVKRYFAPAQLEAQLVARGWDAQVSQTATFFIHGSATLPGR